MMLPMIDFANWQSAGRLIVRLHTCLGQQGEDIISA